MELPENGVRRERVFPGKSEMATRMRDLDWSRTALGPVENWPESLKSVVRTLLVSRYPMMLAWGEGSCQLYNDAYSRLLGEKHPGALGSDTRVVMAEAQDVLGPIVRRVKVTGEASWIPSLLLRLERAGYTEEAYFSVSHAPVEDDEGEIRGILSVCSEVTQQVVGERRLHLLRDLGLQVGDTFTLEETCREIERVVAANPLDVPFALLYLEDSDGETLQLKGAMGCERRASFSPEQVRVLGGDCPWPLWRAMQGETVRVESLGEELEARGGPWREPVREALLMPLARHGSEAPMGVLVMGVSPSRELDESYQSFFELLAGQVAGALRNARAHEEERRRAALLEELDRAKTQFFSNVSHEFRTPLTLMLGPLEEVLRRRGAEVGEETRAELQMVHRNALRLLRLVNTLLDFSRLEAGRVEACYQPTDLATLTQDLASAFRSAVERGGVALRVACEALSEPVYVDRHMWEKVVMNLLSNAFKHTLEGEIEVRLRPRGRWVELEVQDTGEGIAAEEVGGIFERFSRVPNARARTHEGTGIGLSLTRELVRLHGGNIEVESEPGRGSLFRVRIPLGAAHLPAEQVRARGAEEGSREVEALVEEALRWGGEEGPKSEPRTALPDIGARPQVLVVEDNADLRDYLRRLLEREYEVRVVQDGESALQAVGERVPDLILSDAMMPGMDGFQLLRAIREHPRARPVPFLLLSARAGEESRVEGLEAGADDYLAKPFSARELRARVRTHLEMARVRQGVEERERLLEETEATSRAKSNFMATMSHELRTPLNAMMGYTDLLDLGIPVALPEGARNHVHRIRASAEHLLHLIEEILTFSRVESGRETVDPMSFSPVHVVREVAQSLRSRAETKGLRVDLDLEDAPRRIRSDFEKLRQVLTVLVDNAVKFTARGEIRIRVSEEDSRVLFRIQDSGRGIPAQCLEKVFEPFWQVDQGSTREAEGTGLGLAVARQLAHLLEGEITVESRVGEGSTFTLSLPLESSAAALEAASAA